MSGHSHDPEPVRGLPERLPPDERILWQGAPSWGAFASQVFHLRLLALYFGLLLAWNTYSDVAADAAGGTVALSILRLTAFAIAAIGVLALFSWLACKATVYTVTDKRVVIRSGVAFPATVNIPFKFIDTAALKTYRDGTGNILLSVAPSERLAYLLLWPHALPWRINRAQPLLRAVRGAEFVAEILTEALTGSPAAANRYASIKLVSDHPAAAPGLVPSPSGRRSPEHAKSVLRRSAERLDVGPSPRPAAGI